MGGENGTRSERITVKELGWEDGHRLQVVRTEDTALHVHAGGRVGEGKP